MLKQLIIILICVFVSCFGAKYNCTNYYKPESCTLGLRLTERDHKFEPVAPNPLGVTILSLKGKVPVLTNGFCKAFPYLNNFDANLVSMEVIKEFTFHDCEKLEVISMNGNKFKEIEKNSFKGLINLKELHLSGGNIAVFDVDLADSIKLEFLSLSSLNIVHFPGDNLERNKHLKKLHLYSNNLIDLNVEEILKNTPILTEIRLANNDFKCSRLPEIIKLLKEKQVSFIFKDDGEKKVFNLNLNFCKHIEKLSIKLDQYHIMMNEKLEVTVQNITNILTNQSKLLDEKFENFTGNHKFEHHQIDQQNQAKDNIQDIHDISLWIFTTITFLICIIIITFYFMTNKFLKRNNIVHIQEFN